MGFLVATIVSALLPEASDITCFSGKKSLAPAMELCEKLLMPGADRPIDAAELAAADLFKVVFVG
jgi:hypothetical protein